MTETATLHPIWTGSRQQQLFRRLLEAMSYPGRVVDCGDLLEGTSMPLGVLACMLDHACSVADPCALLDAGDLRMLDADQCAANDADWLLMPAGLAPGDDLAPRCGHIHEPEASCTLVLDGLVFGTGRNLQLRGPGIAEQAALQLDGLDQGWLQLRACCCAKPPMGIDIVCCSDRAIACLPRTTVIEEG